MMVLQRRIKKMICILLIISLLSICVHTNIHSSLFSTQAEEINPAITIQNVQSYPKQGDYWTVAFQVRGKADLVISAVENTTWKDSTCSCCDLIFNFLKNETQFFNTVWENGSIRITNFSSSTLVYESSKVLSLGKHVLKFSFGDDITYAYNDASNWWNNNWGYRKKITINHSQVAGELSDFPVLVNLSDTDLHYKAEPTGKDIAFISYEDNNTQFKHEIENYSDGNLTAWVKIPHLSSTHNTNFWLYYGNSDCDSQQDSFNVWNENFKMVHHLDEKTNPHTDSTMYSNNGIGYGGVNQSVQGKVDGANNFDGTNDCVLVNQSDSLNISSELTIEAWIRLDTIQDAMIIDKENAYRLWFDNYGDPEWNNFVFEVWNGSGWEQVEKTLKWSTGNYYYLVGSFNGTALQGYRNSTQINTSEYSDNISKSNNDVYIGTYEYGELNFSGIIDEVRVSNVSRNSSWIQTTYNTIQNQSEFLNLSSEETAAPVLSNPYPSDGDEFVPSTPSYFEITVEDPNPDKLNITWRTNHSGTWQSFNNTNGSGKGVDDGTYQVTNTSWVNTYDRRYFWSVNVTDGTHWTNQTYSFIMHQFNPVINSIDLKNISGSKLNNQTGNLDVNKEYVFTLNITDKNGWKDIDFINLTSWYDFGDETTHYNQTQGGNFNLFLQYQNKSDTGVFHKHWPDDETTLQPMNCTEYVVNETTRIINFSFIPGNQTRCATSNESWSNVEDDLYSWNLNCSVTDTVSNNKYYTDEYGVNYYSALRAPDLVEITGAPGMIEQSSIFTIDFISNDDYSLNIYFDNNLTQVDGPDKIGINGNLSILKDADTSDDIIINETFTGVGENNAIMILSDRSSPADGTKNSVDVQFELSIPFGTWGRYSSNVIKKIERM